MVNSKIKGSSSASSLIVKPAVRITLLIMVFSLTYLFCSKKIIFVNADLGRHLKNGEVFFEHYKPISTNFYSYTEPGLTAINHHWGSGVVFYLVQKIAGFKGLSVFFSLLASFTVLLMFLMAERKSHTYVAFLVYTVCIPLIADRTEIRPEIFSLFMLSVYYYLLESYRFGRTSFKKLVFVLPLLQVLWVNLHLFFFMGIVLICIYGFNDVINKKEKSFKNYLILGGFSLLACFINPFGLDGVLTPLTIFNNYGYMVAENQSVFFMQDRFGYPQYVHFEVLMVIAVCALIYVIFKNNVKEFIPELLLMLVFGFIAFRAIRGIPIMCLFLLPIAAFSFQQLLSKIQLAVANTITRAGLVIGIIMCLFFVSRGDDTNTDYLAPLGKAKGFKGGGIYEQIQRSAIFFKQMKMSGPIFNNYDIGGYLIYHLYPTEKVFVDNRPEAYSVDFFNKVYNPMLEKEAVWLKMDSIYKFNCIYFFRLDETTYGQPFLIRRIQDHENWAPVHVDDVAIIFLRRNDKNRRVIDAYELPPSTFNSVPTDVK